MKRALLILAILTAVGAMVAPMPRAAETEVHGRIYGNWMLNKTKGFDNANTFGIGRSYFTANSRISDHTSGRITMDLKETDFGGKTRYEMILKYAYFDWKPEFTDGRAAFRFGLVPQQYIALQEDLWGRRYLEKTTSDLYGAVTSSDLGANVIVHLGQDRKLATVIGAVLNGTSYSDLVEVNKQKDFNVVAEVTPLKDNEDFKRTTLIGQYYYGVQNVPIAGDTAGSDFKHQLASIGGLLAYRNILDAGADLDFLSMGQGPGNADIKSQAMTFYGTLYLEGIAENAPGLKTLNVFGRVDMVDPNTDVSDDGNTYVILGFECSPVKGFKASLNYRSRSYQDDTKETDKSVNFNTLYRF
jgi:hypothetical protein